MLKANLVSVIIRTIGRREGIKKALDSVARQTHKNIQVVIINDSDCNLDTYAVPANSAISFLDVIRNAGKHGRSRAANLGLIHAIGEYILFLDDDDWIDDGHIEKLLHALEENKSNCALAYTDTLLVNEKGCEIGRFEDDICYKHILAANFMPIHSVLFKSEVKTKGCRFDETLDIYEDWDFWIQASRIGAFVYSPGISAYYVFSPNGNSDAHSELVAKKSTIAIIKKWRHLWSDEDIYFLMQGCVASRKIKKLEESAQAHIRAQEIRIEVLAQQEEAARATYIDILNSKSWALTSPIRKAANLAREANFFSSKIKNKVSDFIGKFRRLAERGSDFHGNIKYKTFFKQKHTGKLCVFSHFDKHGLIDDCVVYYLHGLAAIGCDIVFVTTANDIQPEEVEKINHICAQVIIKENVGYDFGAWRTGLMENMGFIENYEHLILCNDSVYAPLDDFSSVFMRMNDKKLDAWSITDSFEVAYHMQSYFLVFSKRTFTDAAFYDFWNNYLVYKEKRNIIEKYEIGLSKLLVKKGFSIGAYCETGKITTKKENISHVHWRECFVDRGCPTLKVELLRDNPLQIDIEDVEEMLCKNSSYPYVLIKNHLKRILGQR